MSTDRDFIIELQGAPGRYQLRVRSPAGEESGEIQLDPATLVTDLQQLRANVLASAARFRGVGTLMSELELPLRRVGVALYDAVFGGGVAALFLASRNEVERRDDQLRLVLRLPAELAMLPWELLFSQEHGGYLCRRNTLVRYVDVPEPVRPLQVDLPLRVLGMVALPGDLASLDASEEKRQLEHVLDSLVRRGLVSLTWVDGQSWQDAQAALLGGCHVFHFIGHGGFDSEHGEGMVAFADAVGRQQRVRASALADLLSLANPMPRLVVLNSCQTATGIAADVFSSTGATLVRRVPAVVAMQFAITDEAATAFSAGFYQALANNRGVDESVRACRVALTGWHAGTLEWITPVLYMRSRDGQLFDVRGSAVPAEAQTEPVGSSKQPILDRARATRDAPALFRTVRKSQPLSAVAFSPDSRWLALADSAGFARLEEVTSGTEGLVLQHPGPVLGLAFSQDGRWLATVDEDGTARIWDAISGKERLAIPSRGVEHVQMAFAPDGRRLATGGDDGIVRTWDASYGLEQLQVSEFWEEAGRAAHVNGLSFSPDGRWLATAHTSGIAVIWDAHTGQKQRTYQHTDTWVDCVSFSSDGRFLAVGGMDGRTQVVDIETGRVVLAVAHPDEGSQSITSVGLSPDGRWLATSSFDTSARVWDAHDGHEHLKITHEHVVNGVVFSPDGHWLATGSADQTCQIWQLA